MEPDNRRCPIQAEYGRREENKPATAIPWWLAELAYEYYAERNGTSQSLERIAERGGFGRDELVKLIRREP